MLSALLLAAVVGGSHPGQPVERYGTASGPASGMTHRIRTVGDARVGNSALALRLEGARPLLGAFLLISQDPASPSRLVATRGARFTIRDSGETVVVSPAAGLEVLEDGVSIDFEPFTSPVETPGEERQTSVSISPDGRTVASSRNGGPRSSSRRRSQPSAGVRDPETGRYPEGSILERALDRVLELWNRAGRQRKPTRSVRAAVSFAIDGLHGYRRLVSPTSFQAAPLAGP